MKHFFTTVILFALLHQAVYSQEGRLPVKWDVAALEKVPESTPMPKLDHDGVKAALLQGVGWRGDETRFFVYYGIPEGADAVHPVPAMVLIHGGGGTARWEWVKQWVDRGYAAIAMGNNGQLPVRIEGEPFDKRAENRALLPGGIPLECGDFEHALRPVEDQWAYCAVANIMLSHSFLLSLPGVDADRIGVTGNSWGGFLTLLSAAVDKRYKFAAPVYGCGFYGEFDRHAGNEGEAWTRWLDLWDPSHYIPVIDVPISWACGNTDFYFSFGALQKSFALAENVPYKAVRSPMVHTDGGYDGGVPEETYALADHMFKGGADLPKVGDPKLGKRDKVSVTYDPAGRVPDKVELLYTTSDEGPWEKRQWHVMDVGLPRKGNTVEVVIPADAWTFYFNVTTSDGLVASSSAMFRTSDGFVPASPCGNKR